MSQGKSILSRRKFLLTVGAGGVATAAATVATTKSQQSTGDKDKDKRAGAGYSESAHIRNYYRTTKV